MPKRSRENVCSSLEADTFKLTLHVDGNGDAHEAGRNERDFIQRAQACKAKTVILKTRIANYDFWPDGHRVLDLSGLTCTSLTIVNTIFDAVLPQTLEHLTYRCEAGGWPIPTKLPNLRTLVVGSEQVVDYPLAERIAKFNDSYPQLEHLDIHVQTHEEELFKEIKQELEEFTMPKVGRLQTISLVAGKDRFFRKFDCPWLLG